jgi:[NiFe] hydrogenase small subunit
MSKSSNSDLINALDRREFLKYCSTIAAVLGLGPSQVKSVAEVLTSGNRPPVIWLHFSECTGCSESFLRATKPSIDSILLETISLDYHETLLAGAGQTAIDTLQAAADRYAGQFFCVVEGAVPTAANGVYGMIGGKTMLSIAKDICPKAMAVLAFGNCSSFGGIAAAAPNPTGAKGIREAAGLTKIPVVKIPGCAPNPFNLVGTLVQYLLKGKLPPCDDYGRPLFAYEETLHHTCPYEEHTPEAEERCTREKGCKGRKTKNNCTKVLFNDESFPMKVGHPCIGCSEPEFWDKMTPFYERKEGEGKRRKEGEGKKEPYVFDSKWVIDPIASTRPSTTVAPSPKKVDSRRFNIKGQSLRRPENPYQISVTRSAK